MRVCLAVPAAEAEVLVREWMVLLAERDRLLRVHLDQVSVQHIHVSTIIVTQLSITIRVIHRRCKAFTISHAENLCTRLCIIINTDFVMSHCTIAIW